MCRAEVGKDWWGKRSEDGVKSLETFPPSPSLFCALIECAGKICRYVRSLFFFSRLPPLLFSVLSKWRVTVKNTKEKNPWMYCQRMRNTSKRQGWRRSGRHWCSGRPLRRRGKQKMTDRETEREREGEKENLQMEPERERERHRFSKRAKIKLQKKTARDEKGRNRNRSKIEDRRHNQHISTTYPYKALD